MDDEIALETCHGKNEEKEFYGFFLWQDAATALEIVPWKREDVNNFLRTLSERALDFELPQNLGP